MKNILKNILVISLILIAVSLMFGGSKGLNFTSKSKDISVSELVAMVNAGKIKEIEIKEKNIVSLDFEGNKNIAKINSNESIFDVFKYYNVDPLKLEATKVVFKEDIN